MPDGDASGSGRLRSIGEAYLAWRWASDPTRATLDGIHDHDGRLGGWSAADVAGRVRSLREYERRLGEIRRELLDDEDRADAALLCSRVKADLLELESVRRWERDPGFYRGVVSQGLYALAALGFDTAERRMSLAAARLGEVGELLAAAKVNLRNPPRLYTEIAVEEFEGLARFLESGLREAFAAVKDPAVRGRFEEQQARATASVQAFRTWLSSELLPASSGNPALGAELFAAKLLHEEGVDVPLDRLKARGKDLLEATKAAMEKAAGGRSVREALAEAAAARVEGDLLTVARAQLDELRAWAAREVAVPADAACEVQETPVFRRALSFASMQVPGPFETTAREAYYSITLPEPSWSEQRRAQHLSFFNRYSLPLISAHEAFPGHLVQGLAARQARSRIRRALGCGSFSEGWAHYAEQLYAESRPGDELLRLQQLHLALLRICRYHVALEIHAGGMSVEQAAEFFVKEGLQERAVAEREARRAGADPMVLVYTLGKSEILQLRDDWMAATGGSRRAFHDVLLSLGAPPLPLARSILLGGRRRD
jgi:uncharacterized protein (DUF885 family)